MSYLELTIFAQDRKALIYHVFVFFFSKNVNLEFCLWYSLLILWWICLLGSIYGKNASFRHVYILKSLVCVLNEILFVS